MCSPALGLSWRYALSSKQLSLADLLGTVQGPLDWSSTRCLRQGFYSGIKCNGLHATRLVTSRHVLRSQTQELQMAGG